MSISNSRQSYDDCYEAMDKALEAKEGVRVGFNSKEEATFYRMRMHKARQLDRRYNHGRYEDHGDPRKYQSDYDPLMIRIRQVEGRFWVYLEKKPKFGVIEEITDSPRLKATTPSRRF